jgi:gliding motility-associated lipoprotein GldH
MKIKKLNLNLFFTIAVLLSIASCKKINVYEKTAFFSNHEWNDTDKKQFVFTVDDNTSLYNIFVVIRHEDAYRYKNIWLDVNMKASDTSIAPIAIKREFLLADNTHWLGSAMDDIIEHRIKFNAVPLPLKKGNYTFYLAHVMREQPLQYILNAGIRVEKVKP